ncbi:hypothetical protein ACLI09_04200 [Flavobacterium sp. RHBU_24]|uniref:hypothetical protein n=1 Tax=Flavobacterium sp. RHBU_24 TaxID=3391185 RepID=UPI003985029B
MKKSVTGTIALIAVIYVLMQNCSVDFISSIIPGWHTTIMPPLFITSVGGLWLIAVVFIYFLILKKETSDTTAYIYVFMTVPFLLCDILPLLYDVFGPVIIGIYITVFCITIIPFIVAQIVFVVKLFAYTIKDRRT